MIVSDHGAASVAVVFRRTQHPLDSPWIAGRALHPYMARYGGQTPILHTRDEVQRGINRIGAVAGRRPRWIEEAVRPPRYIVGLSLPIG